MIKLTVVFADNDDADAGVRALEEFANDGEIVHAFDVLREEIDPSPPPNDDDTPSPANEPVSLTADEAIALLPASAKVHTFRKTPVALVGADHDRETLIADIRRSERIEIGGSDCQAVNHGLVIFDRRGPLFIECDKGTDYAKIEQAHRA